MVPDHLRGASNTVPQKKLDKPIICPLKNAFAHALGKIRNAMPLNGVKASIVIRLYSTYIHSMRNNILRLTVCSSIELNENIAQKMDKNKTKLKKYGLYFRR